MAVFVDAEAHVDGGGGEEFGGARGYGGGGLGAQAGGQGVDCVGGEVGAGVEAEDEEEGLGDEEVLWCFEERLQRV